MSFATDQQVQLFTVSSPQFLLLSSFLRSSLHWFFPFATSMAQALFLSIENCSWADPPRVRVKQGELAAFEPKGTQRRKGQVDARLHLAEAVQQSE